MRHLFDGPKNPMHHLRYCETHAKKGYASRKDAKRAIRYLCEPGMSAYRCDAVEGLWHIGHTPNPVIRGAVSRDEIAPARRRP